MKLIEVKILYNADYCLMHGDTVTEEHVDWIIKALLQCPDVIHISRTIILPDGEHDD